jgi:hypothetical protein
MSRNLELSDGVYEELEATASASGITPEAWIARHLPSAPAVVTSKNGNAPRTMADLFAGRVGLVASKGDGRLSEDSEKLFGEGLEAKRQAGTL